MSIKNAEKRNAYSTYKINAYIQKKIQLNQKKNAIQGTRVRKMYYAATGSV